MGFLTNPDGTLQWLEPDFRTSLKNKSSNTSKIEDSIFQLYDLFSCNIETEVVGQSIQINKKDASIHLELDQITSIEISIDTVKVNTSDDLSYYLTFISEAEAINGYNKIENAIDGVNITCTDSNLVTQFFLTPYDNDLPLLAYPTIIFVDNNSPFEVTSKSDLITKLNNLTDLQYTITDFVSSTIGLTFTYKPYKEEYLPKVIKYLSRQIQIDALTDNLLFRMDLLNNPYFLFSNGVEYKATEDIYTFPNKSLRSIRVYFAKHECNLFEIGNAIEYLNFVDTTSVIDGVSSNSPNIKKFISANASVLNLPIIFANSIALDEVIIDSCGVGNSINFSGLNIKSISMENCATQNITLPTSIENLYLNNISISTLSGTFSKLTSININNCGILSTINLTGTILRSISVINTPADSFNVSSNGQLYSIELVKTHLTTVPISGSILSNLNSCDLRNNDLLEQDDLETFLIDLVYYNNSQGGYLNVVNKNSSLEFNENIFLLKSRGWEVVLF
jgi:DNA-binding LytR/AlgR family response regulator